MFRLLMFAIVIVIIPLGVVFHLRNDHLVVLDYLVGAREYYFSVWMLVAMITGAVLGVAATVPVLIRLKRENSRLRRQLHVNEKELNNLRVIPVKDMR